MTQYVCNNCGHMVDEGEFPPAKDLSQRLDAGGLFTDRECPKCGALAYPRVKFTVRNTHDRSEKVEVEACSPWEAARIALAQVGWEVEG